jgi:hypothetical protein
MIESREFQIVDLVQALLAAIQKDLFNEVPGCDFPVLSWVLVP